MYGNGTAEADGERRQDRQHEALEALLQHLPLVRRDVVERDDADPVLGELRPQHVSRTSRAWRSTCGWIALAQRVDRLARVEAGAALVGDPGVDLVVQAGDADHEELVEVRRVDRRELQRARAAARTSSSASCSTRSLKATHETSRLNDSVGVGEVERGRAAAPNGLLGGGRRCRRRCRSCGWAPPGSPRRAVRGTGARRAGGDGVRGGRRRPPASAARRSSSAATSPTRPAPARRSPGARRSRTPAARASPRAGGRARASRKRS